MVLEASLTNNDAPASAPNARGLLEALLADWPILPPAVARTAGDVLERSSRARTCRDDAPLTASRWRLIEACTPASAPRTRSFVRYLADRICADETHPYLRRCAVLGPDGVPAVFAEWMAEDLRRLKSVARAVDACAGAASSGPEPAASREPAVAPDPWAMEAPPWSASTFRSRWRERFEEASPDWEGLARGLGDLVHRFGLGREQGCAAFRLEHVEAGRPGLNPVHDFDAFELDWLAGNEERVRLLEENTRNLLDGYRAHNALIWGPRGCGKSSLVRGLITRYWERGLRGVEVPAASYELLPRLFALVRQRRERFIAVLDNAGLDRRGSSARALSSVLDGGLERVPVNLVFYATSNFKDLIDRDGDRPQGPPPLQVEDAPADRRTTAPPAPGPYDPQAFQRLDERRALDDRFPLKVSLDLPGRSRYEAILLDYARRAGIAEEEESLLEAFRVWCLRNNHDLVGGRTARDFILSRYPGAVRRR